VSPRAAAATGVADREADEGRAGVGSTAAVVEKWTRAPTEDEEEEGMDLRRVALAADGRRATSSRRQEHSAAEGMAAEMLLDWHLVTRDDLLV
jgi:hypothetical protein